MGNVMRDAAVILIKEKLIPAALEDALRRYHAGADRGELRTLLCEAWGNPVPERKMQTADIDRPTPLIEHRDAARLARESLEIQSELGIVEKGMEALRRSRSMEEHRDAEARDDLAYWQMKAEQAQRITAEDRARAKRLADRGDYALADSIREWDEEGATIEPKRDGYGGSGY